ncbi:MAG: hypothetical protein AB7I59_30255 [Geminicoccaceae bacterium]
MTDVNGHVVPMHCLGASVLARVLRAIESEYRIEMHGSPELLLAQANLPQRTVVVLPGA